MSKYTPTVSQNKANLTKRELVLSIWDGRHDIPQKIIKDIVHETIESIHMALAQGITCEFRGFGVLFPVVRKARIGRNPKKPLDTVTIPARVVVKFKAGKILKKQLAHLGAGGAE